MLINRNQSIRFISTCRNMALLVSLYMNSVIFQISHLKTPLEKLQEINKNTLGPLLPVEVVSYVEALSHSSWSTMSDSASDNETLHNTTINVSGSSPGALGFTLIPKTAYD